MQEAQVVPSIVKMNYYLIEPEILHDLYKRILETNQIIIQIKEYVKDIQEKLTEKNLEMNKNIEITLKEQIYQMKQELTATEKLQKKIILKQQIKVGTITFLIGLLISAVFFLIHK